MGQIANQMALELIFKIKERIKEKKEEKKQEKAIKKEGKSLDTNFVREKTYFLSTRAMWKSSRC